MEPDMKFIRNRDALAYVCTRLDWFRQLLPDKANATSSPLQQLLDAARHGQDCGNALDTLHSAVQATGDALGVYQAERRGGLDLTGVDDHEPPEIVYLCPISQCSGRRVDHSTAFPLICTITGEQLLRERL